MRGIATTRTEGRPADLDAAIGDALRIFDRFIDAWVGPAAHGLAFNSPDCERVRDAIVAVAETAHRDRIIGQAVFKVSYSSENKSRLQYECMTPVFEEPQQPINSLAGYRRRREGHFQILAVVEPL